MRTSSRLRDCTTARHHKFFISFRCTTEDQFTYILLNQENLPPLVICVDICRKIAVLPSTHCFFRQITDADGAKSS